MIETGSTQVLERFISGQCDPFAAALPGVDMREFVSAACGARGVSTGTATFQPGGRLPQHKHACSEALTVLSGEASCCVEGRTYKLRPFDCIHVPAGTAHESGNDSPQEPLIALWSFATGAPSRELVQETFPIEDRTDSDPRADDPEHIVRFREASRSEPSPGVRFCELCTGRFGAVGIEGGYDEFDAGSSTSFRIHDHDESVTIVTGKAVGEVAGRRYRLSGYDTLFVPRGCEHLFRNESAAPMALVWVRAAGNRNAGASNARP
jgi:quercetin dioxygenase-like cupin family protein